MAELTGDGPDVVAYQALIGIALNEKKTVHAGVVIADKAWILSNLQEIYTSMNNLVRK